MKKKITSIVCSLILVALFVVVSIPASAAATQTLVTLPSLNTWTQTGTFTRSLNHGYVRVRLNSVYPTDDSLEDICSAVGFRLVSSDSSTVISDPVSVELSENEGYKYVYLADGTLSTQKVNFGFRGLNYISSYAAVSCDPM